MGLPSLFDSLFGSIDLFLSYISVSVISPESIWPKIISITVFPTSVWYIGDSPALIVKRHVHDLSVLFIADSLVLEDSQFLLFKFVEGPLRTDSNNIVLFFSANFLIIIVCDKASLEVPDFSLTESGGNSFQLEVEVPGIDLGEGLAFVSLVSKRIVMSWVFGVEVGRIGVWLNIK